MCSRYNVVKIEFVPRPSLAAILAGALVAGIDVISTKANLTLGHTIITDEQNHPGNPDYPVDHAHRFVVYSDRQIAPALKIESLVLLIYRFSDALVEEGEGAAHRSDMDRQIRAIENQYLGVEDGINRNGSGIVH